MKAGEKSNAEAQRGGEAERTERWPLVRLGDVCEVINGMWKGVKPPFKNVGIIRSTNFTKQCEFSIKNTVFIDVEEKKFYSRRLQVGDLVVERSGGAPGLPVGRCVYIDALDGEYSVSNFTSILRVNNQKFLDPKYLWRYLIALYYQGATEGIQSNTTGIHNLDFKAYLNFQVPLPPLATQRAIVARLDSALARAGALEKRFAAIAQNAELSFKAMLAEEFGETREAKAAREVGVAGVPRVPKNPRNLSDPRNPSSPSDPSKPWPLVRLGDVCEIDGKLVQDYAKYANYPHIGIDCIEKGTGALKGYRTVAEDKVKSGKYHFTPHHIIYSKIRPNLNKVATPEFEGLCSADSYAILPKSNCKRRWLAYLLRSENFLGYVVPISNTRAGMPKVNREELLAFEFPLPPLPVQRAIVSRLDAARKRADGIAALARQAAEAAANLRKALLKEAFE